MKIRSWVGGLALFGLFYAVLIIALSVWQWPTLAKPYLNMTFEDKLSAEAQGFVMSIFKSKAALEEPRPSYELLADNFSVADEVGAAAYHDVARMVNGHVIVFESGTSEPRMDEIATQYLEILREHQINETTSAIIRLFFTLFIPVLTVGLFAWAGNSLWSAIQKLN